MYNTIRKKVNIMKKLLSLILCVLLMASCKNAPAENNNGKKGEPEVEGIKFEDRNITVKLDFTEGTGFEWMVVNKTDNLNITDDSYHVDRDEPASTGESGIYTMNCSIIDDNNADLILKLERKGDMTAQYISLRFYSDGTKITGVDRKNYIVNNDFEVLYKRFSVGGLLMQMLKGWEYETYDKNGTCGFLLRVEGEKGEIEYLYTDLKEFKDKNSFERKIMVSDNEYTVGYDKDHNVLYMHDGGNVLVRLSKAKWANDRLPEIIIMTDLMDIEPYNG